PPLVSLTTENRGPLAARDISEDAGLVKIANNFTQYTNSPYWGRLAYEIIGPQGGRAFGSAQRLATSFTPKANHVATRVEVAALYHSGSNEVVLSIYDDAGGVPGKSLHSWNLTNLPSAPCCA